MRKFSSIIKESENSEFVLHGNSAFALGVIHAGYHAADGYPGTPSTEVMESLLQAPDHITADWSVNEAVSVGVAVGHATAGRDAVVTMKVPGVFQAGDVIASASFTKITTGALVIYVATDHEPSSTQYIVDSRDFFSSLKVPVIEPRNHQELYSSAATAADLSREYSTPVVVLVSAILAHSHGTVKTGSIRSVEPQEPFAGSDGVALPSFARKTFDEAVLERIPQIRHWAENSALVTAAEGEESWGVICSGEACMIVNETLNTAGLKPSVLELGITNPIPVQQIKKFIESLQGGTCFLIEDGERFIEKEITFAGLKVIGKENYPTITNWTPDLVLEYLHFHGVTDQKHLPNMVNEPVKRPASICPGCPYRALSLVIQKFKRQKKLEMVFGDIGCSTLLHTYDALDINFCMGASESIRQGYVISRPEKAGKVISLIGDSSECHSGMDATRNGQFRNIPGVKIILDNNAVAMTGYQESPTSQSDSSLNLIDALKGEGVEAFELNSYDMKSIEKVLTLALENAEKGALTALILKAPCLFVVPKNERKKVAIQVNEDICIKCNKCDICPSISKTEENYPRINSTCTRCGVGDELCMSLCPVNAIGENNQAVTDKVSSEQPYLTAQIIDGDSVAGTERYSENKRSYRVAFRGVGGQGVLFMSKLFSSVIDKSNLFPGRILAGEVHGMAQKGGAVCSTLVCGDVSSPILGKKSADILIALEYSEILQDGFLDLLKPGGTIILNNYSLLPRGLKPDEYPSIEKVQERLKGYKVVRLDLSEELNSLANTAVMGVVSQLDEFESVELSEWENSLAYHSPSERVRTANLDAFHKGREAYRNSGDLICE